MSKFFLKNMGCKSNQLEGNLIEQNLIENGFKKAEKIEDADFFILNSCTVTHKSDNEAFSVLRHVKRIKPEIKTVMTGCIAQIERDKLLEHPFIDVVLGNDEKLEISKFINDKISVSCLDGLNNFHDILLTDTKKTRASLKIQDGCDNRCSYCIIPFARGKNRSADLEFILKQIRIYEDAGFKEIVLTGIHIGQWGLEEGRMQRGGGEMRNLLYLLKNIEEKTNITRFRLGSLNPLEISDEMLIFLKNSEKFSPHFHLSLQSMCDKTLKSMNRHYTAMQSIDLIDKIREYFPLGFVGSDVIAGFAGESEDDFSVTVENLKKAKLSQIHTFPYSVRKGTIAEKFDGHLSQATKEERASVIKAISAQKYAEFLERNLGSIQEVLIEKKPDRKTGFLKGVTRNYINVLIEQEGDFLQYKNTLAQVKLSGFLDDNSGKIKGGFI